MWLLWNDRVLPLAEGDRIVGLENWDTSWNNQEDRIIHDFVAWRSELTSVEDLAAFRQVQRNMIGDGQPVEQISIAEMTASAFRLARVSPVLGRPLIDADERKGAPEVVVIGYTVWKNRFASRDSVIGESVRLGATVHTDRRKIAADDFFHGLYQTALQPGELITAVSFPAPQRAAYVKFKQPASRFALVGVFVSQGPQGTRVAVTGDSLGSVAA